MEVDRFRLVRRVPERLAGLVELALDTRWTWNHQADALWQRLDLEAWRRTQNAWLVLQSVPSGKLEELAKDDALVAELERQVELRRAAREQPTWFEQSRPAPALSSVAYFSMEFGLSEALPLYSGGLGVLAGDLLKGASDLGVPIIGVGLLYQSGYFRQVLDESGAQQALFPYNNPMLLPVIPTLGPGGEWRHVTVALPGRELRLRCWEVAVGRATLYLLDSNDPLNTPSDRTITGELYADLPELRLQQEIALGIGGFRLLEELGLACNVLHLNEGHAALAVLERAREFMKAHGQSFEVALACTRAGNLFTTHTPVEAAFDRFAPELMERYFRDYARELGLTLPQLLALGRSDPSRTDERFAMPLLAVRGAGRVNGVSQMHGAVSRALFQPLFPGWPRDEVPIAHVTNGVHVPSWDSPDADRVWEQTCGKQRWLGELSELEPALRKVPDQVLWNMRNNSRRALIEFVRERVAHQLATRGASRTKLDECAHLLDPDNLTLGFARRFASYKRPNLLLRERERLLALLQAQTRPVQLIIAGKAHPSDPDGARLLHAWSEFLRTPEVARRAVFIEDYDLAVAQKLVQGVDVWINTPRRSWEACGTSGMKLLVNGGLNLSVLDGWWAEYYAPELGFAVGSERGRDGDDDGSVDQRDAAELFRCLEQEVVPAFYERDTHGVPVRWLGWVRESMARLTPACSANRMLREYVTDYYAPLAAGVRERSASDGALGQELVERRKRLEAGWEATRFGELQVEQRGASYAFYVQAYLGELHPDEVKLELYADASEYGARLIVPMERGERLSGAGEAYPYAATAPADRPAAHYTPRIVPCCPHANVPLELATIRWHH